MTLPTGSWSGNETTFVYTVPLFSNWKSILEEAQIVNFNISWDGTDDNSIGFTILGIGPMMKYSWSQSNNPLYGWKEGEYIKWGMLKQPVSVFGNLFNQTFMHDAIITGNTNSIELMREDVDQFNVTGIYGTSPSYCKFFVYY